MIISPSHGTNVVRISVQGSRMMKIDGVDLMLFTLLIRLSIFATERCWRGLKASHPLTTPRPEATSAASPFASKNFLTTR